MTRNVSHLWSGHNGLLSEMRILNTSIIEDAKEIRSRVNGLFDISNQMVREFLKIFYCPHVNANNAVALQQIVISLFSKRKKDDRKRKFIAISIRI